MKINLGASFYLPLEVVTQSLGILAKRRAGKSYTGRRFAEQLHKAGLQIVITDPKGDWWGIRSSADGKSPGLPIVILGGEHGDVPLETNSGEVVAKLVVHERVSVLLDLASFRKHEVATFMTAFLENLYRLKAREEYRTPMMLIIDEADAIAPQKPQKGEERMLGAAEDIVRRGGQRGIGCTLITQRSAVLNKNVLTQTQILVPMRTIAPQDLDAMKAWVDVHGTQEERKTLMESLPSLPTGTAWFWSPGWPTEEGIFKRVEVLPIETFDSGATPKPGEKRIQPKNLADVDLQALRNQMAETIERAKADDPKELRKQIADLKKQLSARPKDIQVKTEAKIERVEVPILKDSQIKQLESIAERYEKLSDRVKEEALKLGEAALIIRSIVKDAIGKPAPSITGKIQANYSKNIPAVDRSQPKPATQKSHDAYQNGEDHELTPTERVVLDAVASFPSGATRERIAVFSGRSIKSSSFQGAFPSLVNKGLLHVSGSIYSVTTEGGAIAIPMKGADLDDWLRKLKPSQAEVLRCITEAYPEGLTRDEVSQRTGRSIKSSSFQGAFPALESLELIGQGPTYIASSTLFEE